MKTFALAYLAFVALSVSVPVPARAATAIAFSELIFPLSTFTQILWRPFTAESGYARWVQQYGTLLSNGNVLIYGSSGAPGGRIASRSTLSSDHHSREVVLEMSDARGNPSFGFKFLSTGPDLKPYDPALVARGKLPFFPDSEIGATRFMFSITSSNVIEVNTTHTRVGDRDLITGRYSEGGVDFLVYSEVSGPTVREITYELRNTGASAKVASGAATKFVVRKTLYPGLLEGTETYALDGVPTSLEKFNNAFTDRILIFAAIQWPPVIRIIGQLIQNAAL